MTPAYTRDLIENLTNAQLVIACQAKRLNYPEISNQNRATAINDLMANVGYLDL